MELENMSTVQMSTIQMFQMSNVLAVGMSKVQMSAIQLMVVHCTKLRWVDLWDRIQLQSHRLSEMIIYT